MSTEQSGVADGAERWSALVDGEIGADEVRLACARWRSDDRARRDWHAYQLIGDVLRSEDLASAPGRDEAFLRKLRERLADEPVVLAPEPAKLPMATGRALRRWRTGAAVAAGFVAVAGVLVAMQMPGRNAEPSLAAAPVPPSPVVPVAVTTAPTGATAIEPAAEQAVLVTDGKLIRDARLDRYLAAHQRFAGTSALGVPSAFLRSATAVEPATASGR